MDFPKMNSKFTITPCEHSSKCGTKPKHRSTASLLQAEPNQMSYIVVQDHTKSSTDVFLINKVIGTVP
jgi:hypothetical protein